MRYPDSKPCLNFRQPSTLIPQRAHLFLCTFYGNRYQMVPFFQCNRAILLKRGQREPKGAYFARCIIDTARSLSTEGPLSNVLRRDRWWSIVSCLWKAPAYRMELWFSPFLFLLATALVNLMREVTWISISFDIPDAVVVILTGVDKTGFILFRNVCNLNSQRKFLKWILGLTTYEEI